MLVREVMFNKFYIRISSISYYKYNLGAMSTDGYISYDDLNACLAYVATPEIQIYDTPKNSISKYFISNIINVCIS